MFAELNQKLFDMIVPKGLGSQAFAFSTRDKNGELLPEPIELSRKETLDRLSEINQQIGKMQLIANKAIVEFKDVEHNSAIAHNLAKRCTAALEHCAKISLKNDMLFESMHSPQDPYLMDRKHSRYAEQIDEVALTLSSILKAICKD